MKCFTTRFITGTRCTCALIVLFAAGAFAQTGQVIRVGIDPSWPPFAYYDQDGQARGIDVDILHYLETISDFRFEFVRSSSWSETWQSLVSGRVDILPGVAETMERREQAEFTRPYLESPVALITRSDGPFLTSLHDLEGRSVAIPRDYVQELHIRRHYGRVEILRTRTMSEALLAVSRGDAVATADNLASASYHIRELGLSNLKIAGVTDLDFKLRLAVRKDRPDLVARLNEAINTLPDAKRQEILARWIEVDYRDAINWRTVQSAILYGALIIGALVALFTWWNRRLARVLREQRAAEAALRDRERQLAEANRKLMKINSDLDMVVKMAAHDLNNPLTTILLTCESAMRDDPALQEALEPITRSCHHMRSLIHNLLRLDGPPGQAPLLNIKPTDISTRIGEVLDRYRMTADRKNLTLQTEHQGCSPCWVQADVAALDQIIDNLVSNAVKYSPRGGAILVRLERLDDRVVLEVQDNGPGIPAADRPRLFKRFPGIATEPSGGEASFGIGLSIARQLIDRMDGEIFYREGANGEGACFVITLKPVCPNPKTNVHDDQ